MCRKFKSLYKAHIGRKSNGNTIIQGSELRNPVFLNNTADFVRTLGDIRQYESVEKFAIEIHCPQPVEYIPCIPILVQSQIAVCNDLLVRQKQKMLSKSTQGA